MQEQEYAIYRQSTEGKCKTVKGSCLMDVKEALCPYKKKIMIKTENKSITANFKQQFLSVIKINVNR